MDIEEKSRRDLIERYKRLEKKDNQLNGALAQSKHAISKEVKHFLKTQPTQQVVQKLLPSVSKKSVKSVWEKPKPKPLEEDDYYKKIEEIIRRDFYPDLVKLDALRQFENSSSDQPPSVLLRSTGKSRISSLTARQADPVDDFIVMKRAELGLKPIRSLSQEKRHRMGLNEYLRRFTSEDNASFQQLHEMNEQKFREKIAWMFRESEQYKALQALAGQEATASNTDTQKLLMDGDGKLRTVPAIKFVNNDTQPNIFFRDSGEDLTRAKELYQEKLMAIKDKLGPTCQVVKQNTRLPSDFQVKLQEHEAKSELESMSSVKKNKFDFSVPLTKEEIQAAQLSKQKNQRFDLGKLLARNHGLTHGPLAEIEETPVIKGYKILKETPQIKTSDEKLNFKGHFLSGGSSVSSLSSSFKLHINPLREELGHKIANEASMRKREQKAKDKFNHYSKLGLTMCAQESLGNRTVSDANLKSPLSIRSGKYGTSSIVDSAKSMMTPGSIHSFKSAESNYSGRRLTRGEFSSAGQQLLSKLMQNK